VNKAVTFRDRLRGLLASAPVLALALVVFVVGFGLAVVVTYYNVLYSVDRVALLLGVEMSGPWAPTPDWVRPLLQDLSVVSPALVSFTLLCMAFGTVFLLRAKDASGAVGAGSRFPFPEPYRSYYVQMGLIGTIIGFVIAFSNIDPALEGQAEVLLAALGTALWSTLTAITLAYVVCPLVEVLFRAWLVGRTGVDPDPDPASAIDDLRLRTLMASESLDRFAHSVSSLSSEMDSLQLRQRLVKLEHGLHSMLVELDGLKNHTSSLHQGNQGLNRRLSAVEDGGEELERRVDSLTQRVNRQESGSEQRDQRLDSLERSITRLLEQLRRGLELP